MVMQFQSTLFVPASVWSASHNVISFLRKSFWQYNNSIAARVAAEIFGGVFTPTEAAAIAAGYAFFLGLFVIGTLKFQDIPGILMRAAMTSAVVLLLILVMQAIG